MDNPHSESPQQTQTEVPWQRLSPIAILYFTASSIKALVQNIIYAVPAFALSYSSIVEHGANWLMGVSAFLLLLLGYALLNYYFYRFRLTDDKVEINYGVLKKVQVDLPFSRIQNVKIEQPFYYRPNQFACLELDTAGSAQQEAKIVALRLQRAHQLKKTILAAHERQAVSTHETPSNQEQSPVSETLLNRRSMGDLVLHGITNNRVWIILGGLAPFYDNMFAFVSQWLEGVGIDLQAMFSLETHAWWQLGLYALTLTMLVMMAMALLSIAGSILVFYKFTLSKTADRYIKRSGLLTRQEISMRLSRLQMVERKQDWLDVLLGRINLVFQQNSAGFTPGNDLSSASKIIVPSVTEDDCKALILDAYPDSALFEVSFTRIGWHFILRQLLFWVLPVFAVISALVFSQGHWHMLPIIVGAFIAVLGLVCLRWYRWGFACDDKYFYLRKGLIGVDYACFPLYKIQQTSIAQSVFMRRRKQANLRMVLASGTASVPFINESEALALTNYSLYQVESLKRSWM